MATGDQLDLLRRLKSVLPSRWFPSNGSGTATSPTPILDGLLSGLSALGSWIYSLIQYVRTQTRIATATDGWLDIISADLFGTALPRLPGETDTVFRARIKANLFLPANTRAAVLAAVEQVTGNPARIIEPWQPNDTFVWGRSFWGYDRQARPGNWSNGDRRYQGLIACSLPASTGAGGQPRFGWGNFFWGSGPTNAVALGSWWQSLSAQSGAQLVYNAINRVRSAGVTFFVKFLPPSQLP